MRSRLVVADRIRTARGVMGDALLIQDGLVRQVGTAAQLRRPDLAEDRFPGAVIVPGLCDAHFHPLAYAASLRRLSVGAAEDFDDLVALIRRASDALPPGTPLIGSRLNDETLNERTLPTRAELDRAVEDRPVLIHRYCGHIAIANTAALETAGISPLVPDPAGGSFDRDSSGRPTGVLRETAVPLVAGPLGRDAPPISPSATLDALRGLPTLGLTSIGAIVTTGAGPWCDTGNELATLLEIARDLPLQLAVLVVADDSPSLEKAARELADAGRRLRFLGVKEFADGSLGGHTAALRSPYADRPDVCGTLRLEGAATAARARTSLRLGGKVAVHAIGDAANAAVLDLFEELLGEGADPADLRVEHASVLAETDVARFAALGATASVQPAFMASESSWLEKRVGAARLARVYPLAELDAAGVPLAGGSDCPVEPPHPTWGMATARDRAGLTPEQALSGPQALHLFTDGAARAIGEPPPLGVGSPAAFTVLDRDPADEPPERLRDTRVLATWVDGESIEFPSDSPVWLA